MAKKYLDDNGLEHLWDKIKSYVESHGGGSSSFVTGVKGNAESTYRQGNVNLTPSNIGAIPSTYGTASDVVPYALTGHLIGIAGTNTNTGINKRYSFGATADRPALFCDTDNSQVWEGYTNLHPPTASEVGAVPTTRTVNGKALSSNISLTASDVGAVSTSGGQISGSITLTGGVTVSGHDSAIGAMWYHGTTTSLASATSFTEIPNDASDIDLTTGRWLVTAYGGFPSAVTGYVGLAFMKDGTRVSEGSVLIPATSSTSWSTSISTSIIRDVSSSEKISLSYIQNSGASQNVTWYIRAIRIR